MAAVVLPREACFFPSWAARRGESTPGRSLPAVLRLPDGRILATHWLPRSSIQRFGDLLFEIDIEPLGWVQHSYLGAMIAVKPPPGAMETSNELLALTVFSSARMELGLSSFMEPST